MPRSSTLPLNSHPPNSKRDNSRPLGRSGTTINVPPSASRRYESNGRDHALPQRPGVPNRMNSVQTRYMNMLLALDTIPRFHNIIAAFFTWILLAGFIIFPGTFTSLQKLDNNPTFTSSETATTILRSVKHIPLLVISSLCCGIGASGMLYLYYLHHTNYVWLLNRIFLPGCLNSLAGLISTLINVYAQQEGAWSVIARVTAIVTGSAMVVCGVLFGVYNFWVLERVKRVHGREMRGMNGDREEGLVEKVGRKAREPALEPGSVV